MKTSKILLLIFFIIVTVFGLVGALMISNIFHELNHYDDFKDKFNVTQVCMLADPMSNIDSNKSVFENAGAYVFYNYKNINATELNSVRQHSETDSTIISIIIYILFAVPLIWVWVDVVKELW